MGGATGDRKDFSIPMREHPANYGAHRIAKRGRRRRFFLFPPGAGVRMTNVG